MCARCAPAGASACAPPGGWHEAARGGCSAAMVALALALALSSVAKASARACSATLAVLAAREAATE